MGSKNVIWVWIPALLLLLLGSCISSLFSGTAFGQTASPPDLRLKGFGVIIAVVSNGSEPVFDADGYRIRIAATTEKKFSGALKSIADVKANDWVRYDGKRSGAGELVAIRAEFVPGIEGTKTPEKIAKDAALSDTIPAGAQLIDANGSFVGPHTKVRLGDSAGPCGWHRLATDLSMQERVWRIGMRLVPAFQRQMPTDAKARIHFRFFAVNEPHIRMGFSCAPGLILIPQQVIVRLKSDDQLAAILADRVAATLMAQVLALEPAQAKLAEAAELAAIAALAWDPVAFLAGEAATIPVDRAIEKHIEDHFGRIALALLADAGYDPWAAPEAWKLLDPKNPPSDLSKLNYPDRSEQMLSILKLQYSSTKSN
jgi:hypothetical protein